MLTMDKRTLLPERGFHNHYYRLWRWNGEDFTLQEEREQTMPDDMGFYGVLLDLIRRGFAIMRFTPSDVWVCDAPKPPPKGY